MENEIISKSMALDIKESFRDGSQGPSQDAINLYKDWGFDLKDIQPEILIFHGTDDHFAPIEFAQYKHEQLKKSTYFEYPGEGHLYFLTQFETILKKIREHKNGEYCSS
jgi:pimeloyl-ACP methyl ester carboxylesterase